MLVSNLYLVQLILKSDPAWTVCVCDHAVDMPTLLFSVSECASHGVSLLSARWMADFRHTAFLCATWYRYRSRETRAVSTKCVLFGSCHQHHVRSHRYKVGWHSTSSQRYLYLPPAWILKLCVINTQFMCFPKILRTKSHYLPVDTELFYLVGWRLRWSSG